MFRKGAIFLGFVGLMSATTANGQDGWVEVRAGIEINTAIAFGITVHTVRIDLTRPEFKIQVARHTDAGGFSTTDVWAREVGAVVAINGDWSDINGPRGFRHPTGLSIGDGMHWPNTADFAEWRFMACTVEKTCVFDFSDEARDVHWTWRNVVGGNYALLVVDGVVQNQPGPFYNDDIIHRSAVGLSEDGGTMFLVLR